jgi:hypothetical protein
MAEYIRYNCRMKHEGICKELVFNSLLYYSEILEEELTKTRKSISQDGRCPIQVSNRTPLEYKLAHKAFLTDQINFRSI